MCISLAITAARMGASVLNYAEIIDIHKKEDDNGKLVVCGARLKDRVTSTLYLQSNNL